MNGIMIQLTDKAVQKIQQMIQAKGVSGMNLRVYVEGGGCSGMQYGMAFDEALVNPREARITGARSAWPRR